MFWNELATPQNVIKFHSNIPDVKVNENRNLFTRSLDAIMTPLYVTMGAIHGTIHDEYNPLQGAWQGLKAGNPFGKGYDEGRHSFSRVLETAGWQPESTAGKFAKGVVGFVGDVFLDPSTYLTGGLSALVKGTGRAGAIASHGAKLGKGFTQESAEKFIKETVEKRNQALIKEGLDPIQMTAKEIADDATKLVDKYNKLLGIRTAPRDLRWELKGAPFGEKIFGKYANIGFRIASGEKIAKIGDKTFAPYYSKIRNAIIGSKFGEKFSTTHHLYQLSKTNPEAVYDFIKSAEIFQGMAKNKRERDILVRTKAKAMGLTPEETAQVLKAMEDKTIWKPIKETLRFAQTKEAQEIKEQILKEKEELSKEISALEEAQKLKNEQLEKMSLPEQELRQLELDLHKKLQDLNQKSIDETREIIRLIKITKEELKKYERPRNFKRGDLTIDKDTLVQKYRMFTKDLQDISDISKETKLNKEQQMIAEQKRRELYQNLPQKIKDNYPNHTIDELHAQAQDALFKAKAEMERTSKLKNKKGYKKATFAYEDALKEFQAIDDLKNHAHHYQLLTNEIKLNNFNTKDIRNAMITNKKEIVDDISVYIFGTKGQISVDTWGFKLDELIDMIENNATKNQLIDYVEKFPSMWNGVMPAQYSYIAQKIGYGGGYEYKNWEEYYTKRIQPLRDKLMRNQELTLGEYNLMARLEQDHLKREHLKSLFRGCQTIDDVNAVRTKLANEELEAIFRDYESSFYSKYMTNTDFQDIKYQRQIDNKSALNETGYVPAKNHFEKIEKLEREIQALTMDKKAIELTEQSLKEQKEILQHLKDEGADESLIKYQSFKVTDLENDLITARSSSPERIKEAQAQLRSLKASQKEGKPTLRRTQRVSNNTKLIKEKEIKLSLMKSPKALKKHKEALEEAKKTLEAMTKKLDSPTIQKLNKDYEKHAKAFNQVNKIIKDKKLFATKSLDEQIKLYSKLKNAEKKMSQIKKKLNEFSTSTDDIIKQQQKVQRLEKELAEAGQRSAENIKALEADIKRLKEQDATRIPAPDGKDMREEMFKNKGKTDLNINDSEKLLITKEIQAIAVKNKWNLSDAELAKYIDSVIEEMQIILNRWFKQSYTSMADETISFNKDSNMAKMLGGKLVHYKRELALKLAMKNADKRMAGEAVTFGQIDKAFIDNMYDKAIERHKRLTKEYTEKFVIEGTEVHFKDKSGKLYRGVVHEIIPDDAGNLSYKIKVISKHAKDKIIDKVPSEAVFMVKTRSGLYGIDELVRLSDATGDVILRKEALLAKLDSLKQKLKNSGKPYYDESNKLINEFNLRKTQLEEQIKQLEQGKDAYRDAVRRGDGKTIDDLTKKMKKLEEALVNDEALEVYAKQALGEEDFARAVQRINVAKIVLDDMDMSDKIKALIKELRADFIEMGKKEVEIGKLNPKQFEAMMWHYLPRFLTPDGKKYFRTKEGLSEVRKTLPGFGDSYGYGRVWSPHGISRTIKGSNIPDINKHFEEALKGKHLFSEDIADIYLQRALKHNELIYDNEYMHTMMNIFGKEYTGVVEEGYNLVMNYGKLKDTSNSIARMNVTVDVSRAVREHLKSLEGRAILERIESETLKAIKKGLNKGLTFKQLKNKNINAYIEKFVNETFPKERLNQMHIRYVDDFVNGSGASGALDDLAMPMIKLNDDIVKQFKQRFDDTIAKFTDNIREQLISIEKQMYFEKFGKKMDEKQLKKLFNLTPEEIGKHLDRLAKQADDVDIVHINRIKENLDYLNNVHPLQVRQVNDAIVLRANQMRQLQIERDNSRFLQIFDRVTHLIKINQTAVLPAFHTRNKLSNMFNSFLGTGYDAFSWDFQKQTFDVIKKQGNVEGALKITRPDGTIDAIQWKDLYQEAFAHGAITEGFFAKDIGAGASQTGVIKGLPAKFDPTDTKSFFLYKKGTEIGSFIEMHDRFTHFASQVRQGKTFAEAAESTNKFLLDYSDLTAFEQRVMKRIIPYYTWIKKNALLQLEMMMEQPKVYQGVGKIMTNVEHMNNEDERIDKRFVSHFAQSWVQTPFTTSDGQPILFNPNLPFMDLTRIPDPFNIKESTQTLFTQTNPILKTPIEQIMNKNYFFDAPIVRPGENQVTKRLDHLASPIGWYGIGKGLATRKGTDWNLFALNSTTGLKFMSYNYDKYKQSKIREMLEEKRNQVR